jgi:mannose-6-phosphate isomerase-like protein (cupin superfamily)
MAGSSVEISEGQFSFIDPGTFFHFTTEGKGEVKMILVELK